MVPASTIVVRADGPQVGVIDGSTVHFRTVTLGRDYGSEVELVGGVPDSAELVLNPVPHDGAGSEMRSIPAIHHRDPPAPAPRP